MQYWKFAIYDSQTILNKINKIASKIGYYRFANYHSYMVTSTIN